MDKWDVEILAYIQTFRSALGFYADSANYTSRDTIAQNAVQQDGGKRAEEMIKDLRLLEEKIKAR